MTSSSQSLNRTQLISLKRDTEELNNDITSQEWYWGNTSKEEVNEYMTGLQDGSFSVRDSSNKMLGIYTLTIRKEGENKLVRIICKDGLYGFQEPCQFESVPKLIKYYQSHKLSENNDQLNIILQFPVSRVKSEVKGNVNELNKLSNDDLIQLLIKTMIDIFKLNSKVEEDTNTYNENQKQLDEVKKVLKGTNQIQSWVKSHVIHIMNANNSNDCSGWIEHSKKCLAQLKDKLNNYDQITKEMNEHHENLIIESDKLHRQLQMDRPELKRQNKIQSQISRTIKDRGVPSAVFSLETVNCSITSFCDKLKAILNINNPINMKSTWLLEDIKKTDSIELLKKRGHATFLIRRSQDLRNYTLDVKVDDKIEHCKIFCQNGKYGFIEYECVFESLEELVKTFHVHCLSMYNPILTAYLTYPVKM